ncbi:hypothetical protein BDV23DRAFT_188894 [Aspergillus alliaceus]|uniref:RGS domain-containing protein n=1 Tax=Petromyces alliaceus TaxID=209559 RepID=A0A5N7BSE5_PETAA|nr:hypothetical protein BDV23DRAFT_188894 [Aspergillus alliaceus]
MSGEVITPSSPQEYPTFDKVLNDVAPYPYTLKSFKAYLSQNHCSESLEFLEGMKQYKQAYRSALNLDGSSSSSRSSMLPRLLLTWRNLLSVYILPGSLHELNISTEERNALLKYTDISSPPSPCVIDEAVGKIAQSLESSIFLPYLSSRAALVLAVDPHFEQPNSDAVCEKPSVSMSEQAISDITFESSTNPQSGKGRRGDKSLVFTKLVVLVHQSTKFVRPRQRLLRAPSGTHQRDT